MIYFTSDTHYHHSNIVRGTTRWDLSGQTRGNQSVRDFDTLEEHDQVIVDGINSVVGEDDVLYHLGDWSFGNLENVFKFREQLKVKTIHLCLGNHDFKIRNNKVRSGTISEVKNFGNLISTRDCFTTVQDVLNVKLNGRRFFMSHYAHRIWDKSHHGTMHIFGHSHSSLEYIEWGKSMDVGVDNAKRILGEYRPFSITEIIEILDKKLILLIDHHNHDTN
jgi:calcineurin-like phosphoesterase family protein